MALDLKQSSSSHRLILILPCPLGQKHVSAEASHMCMVMRGVRKTPSETRTEYGFGLENLSELEKNRLLRSGDK